MAIPLVTKPCGLFLVVLSLMQVTTAHAQAPPGLQAVKTDIVYAKKAGETLKMDAYLPQGKGPFPAIMLVHGGGWHIGTKYQLTHQGLYLARRGYVAFSISYRLAPKHRFPAQLEDCRDAIKWIREHTKEYKIDPRRLGAMGYSAGGHLVCLLATTEARAKKRRPRDDGLKVIVAGGAPCELRNISARAPTLSYWLGGTRAQKPQAYQDASPNAFVSQKVPPTFLYHGTIDAVVPYSWTKPYYDSLKKLGVPTEMYRIEDAGHVTAFLHPNAIKKARVFMDRYLQPANKDR